MVLPFNNFQFCLYLTFIATYNSFLCAQVNIALPIFRMICFLFVKLSLISSLHASWLQRKLIMVGSRKTLLKVPLLKLLIKKVEEQSGILSVSKKDIYQKGELIRCSQMRWVKILFPILRGGCAVIVIFQSCKSVHPNFVVNL